MTTSSLPRNEAPLYPVPTAPAVVHHVRFDSDVNQPNGTFYNQSTALLLLHPNDHIEAGAASRLDIPLDIVGPPGRFNKGPVTSLDIYPPLDIPLDDGGPPGPFNRGPVSRGDAHLSLDIPLNDGGPPGLFNRGPVSRADAHLSLDIPLNDEKPPCLFKWGSLPSAATESSLVIPRDNKGPPNALGIGFLSTPKTLTVGKGANGHNRQPSDVHPSNEIPPTPFNHGSVHMGTHYAKTVTITPYGRCSDSTLSFVSLTRPLFS